MKKLQMPGRCIGILSLVGYDSERSCRFQPPVWDSPVKGAL